MTGHSPGFEHVLLQCRVNIVKLLTIWWKDVAELPLLPMHFCLDSWGPEQADIDFALQSISPTHECE
jgi:hypothetical protein